MNDIIPVKVYGKYLYDNAKSFSMLAYIIDECNLHCKYCYNEFPRKHMKLDLSCLSQFVQQVYANGHYDVVYLDLIGGEPLLHAGIESFCQHIAQHCKNIQITIYSNFTFQVERYRRLTNIGVRFILSYHCQCQLDEYCRKLMQFNEYEMKHNIMLNVMYEPEMSKHALDAYNMFKTYTCIDEIEMVMLRGNENYEPRYTAVQLDELKSIPSNAKSEQTAIMFNDGSEMHVSDNYFFEDVSRTNFKNWLCNAGKDFLYVHFNGDVHPCDENDGKVLFNIHDAARMKHMQLKPMICNRCECPCLFDIYKENVFKTKAMLYDK